MCAVCCMLSVPLKPQSISIILACWKNRHFWVLRVSLFVAAQLACSPQNGSTGCLVWKHLDLPLEENPPQDPAESPLRRAVLAPELYLYPVWIPLTTTRWEIAEALETIFCLSYPTEEPGEPWLCLCSISRCGHSDRLLQGRWALW